MMSDAQRMLIFLRLAPHLALNEVTGCLEWTAYRGHYGYGRVSISGLGRALLVHRLAWAVVHGDEPVGKHVLHRCDNPPCCLVALDERDSHLFLGDQRTNVADCISKGRHQHGESNGHAKLTADEVLAIRDLYASDEAITHTDLAKQYGVTREAIRDVINGRRWAHIDSPLRADHARRSAHGERVSTAKLTTEDVLTIRRRFAAGGVMQTELAREYGVAKTNICSIVNGRSWQHLL